jgi:hypothetical protein
MSSYSRRAHDEATIDHSLLALLIVAMGVILGVVIATNLGVALPDPSKLLDSIDWPFAEPGAGVPAVGAGTAVEQPKAGVTPAQAATGAASAPYCAPGQQPTFVLGFAELRQRVGDAMGQPLECEHTNPENGDALQQTSTGLAYYRKATNSPTFTDGWRHWALTAGGLAYWEGESAEPPATPPSTPRG